MVLADAIRIRFNEFNTDWEGKKLAAKKYLDLIKNTLIFSLGSLGSKLILFFMVPLYTNYMTSAEYGVADLTFTVAQFIVPVISVVIHESVLRYGLSKQYCKEDVFLVGCTVIVADIFLSVLLVPLIGLYAPLKPWRWYLCAYLVLNITDTIWFCYLKACGKNKVYALFSIFKTACMAGLNVLFLAGLHEGVKGYLLASILSLLVTDLLIFKIGDFATQLKRAKKNDGLFREMLVYAAPLILNNMSWWVIQSSDKVMVEYLVGAAALGLYTVAAKIPALINVVISIFSQAWGISSITEYEDSNDTGFYSNVLQIYATVVCTACIAYVAVIKIFMRYYVGVDFQEAWKYVPLLLVSAVFSSISSFYGSLYGALKKSFNNMLSTLLAAGTNIFINALLIPRLGIWGAVIGTLAAYIFIAIYRMVDVARFIPIEVNLKIMTVNGLLILVQAIMVSLDIAGAYVSMAVAVLFLACNYKILQQVMQWMKKKLTGV